MAKGSDLDSTAKRSRLAPAKNPYWIGIAGGRGGVSLGYRRPKSGPGTWTVKLVLDGNRREARLAQAADAGAAPDALSYPAAVTAAMAWARQQLELQERQQAGAEPEQPLTVAKAMDAYADAHEARKATPRNYMRGTLKKHVHADAAFATIPMSKLTAEAILAWRRRLAPNLSKRSVNWILTVTRAGLNHALSTNRRSLPATLAAEIKVGTKALPGDTNARKQVLPDADVRRLVDAAFAVDETGDFGRLILVMAATGARFSQVARIRVGDVQAARSRIMVPPARKGQEAKAPAPIAVPVGEDVIARLQPALAGRRGHEPLLLHWHHAKKKGSVAWVPVERQTWPEATTARRHWILARAEAGLPDTTVMLCLRHSSIVRGLSAGLPVRLVAALHDTSVEMIEQHYSAYIVDATEELARRAITPLAPVEVIPLRVVGEVEA
ncbi:tyrosine-type recombinase/integrase [Methylobacterium sp. M6A4_1b]